jgi:hypothetical protein
MKLTSKQARKIEKEFRSRGIRKPYVSLEDGGTRLLIESYPLTVIITDGGCDPEVGPFQILTLKDCTLPRIGQNPTVTTARLFIGQDLCQHASALLLKYHTEAHARSEQQDYDAVQTAHAVEQVERYGIAATDGGR